MPAVSIWMIRISLLWMLSGALGGLLIYSGADEVVMRRIHMPVMMYGWLLTFVLGVAWWIFPRTGRNKRPDDAPAWISFALIQLSVPGFFFVSPDYIFVPYSMLLTASLIMVSVMIKRVKKRGHQH